MDDKKGNGMNRASATKRSSTTWAISCLCLLFWSCSVHADRPTATSTRSASVVVQNHRDLERLESKVKAASKKARAATVSVKVGRGERGGFAFGSGVIVSKEGYVLTAAHVSSRPNQKVTFYFEDGKEAKGVTLGLHQDLDMGLMKITDQGTWPFLTRARSSQLKAGDWVIATGHPGGFESKNAAVVRLGRILKRTSKVILTDCTLVGGDSGGPLVNLNGNVIGVHSRIGADLTTNLHVPIDQYARHWDRLAQKDVWGLLKMSRPFIGIEHDPDSSGARVKKVRGPAARANLKRGDLIVRFNGMEVKSFDKLKSLVSETEPDTTVTIEYKRDGILMESTLVIGAREAYGESQTRDDADLLKDWLESVNLRRGRGRAVVGIGKNADQVKESFSKVLDSASRSTVKVLDNANVVALGTIIDERLIVTKASLLKSSNLHCKYLRSSSFPVKKVAVLKSHDLALLRSSRPLPTTKLSVAKTPRVGALLASSGLNVHPLAIGAVSREPTRVPSEGKLGISMNGEDTDPPVVDNLIVGSGADLAGVEIGDLVTAIDGLAIATAKELVDHVLVRFPGDRVRLTVKRDGQLIELSAKLARYSDFDDALAEFEDFIGGKLSKRRSGFAKVIQHDTAISPLHCGGPVVDVHGNFVGINIARAARTSSYLLPAAEVKIAVDRLREMRKDTVDVGAVTAE